MDPQAIVDLAHDKMDKAVAATQNELATLRTGRANPMILDRVMADYYGTPTPVKQMGNIAVQGGQTLVITPYDKTALMEIEKPLANQTSACPPKRWFRHSPKHSPFNRRNPKTPS
ncbi:MAG: ribosome recycling factor [Vampirovibrionales bacterium]